MTNQFESKVALVTGGNSGLGRAIALAFAKEGAKVGVAARRVPEGEETENKTRTNRQAHAIGTPNRQVLFRPLMR